MVGPIVPYDGFSQTPFSVSFLMIPSPVDVHGWAAHRSLSSFPESMVGRIVPHKGTLPLRFSVLFLAVARTLLMMAHDSPLFNPFHRVIPHRSLWSFTESMDLRIAAHDSLPPLQFSVWWRIVSTEVYGWAYRSR